MFPSDRRSLVANSTNSTRSAGRILTVTDSFHSPMLFLARELDFQEPLDGTGDLKLEHGPFDQGLCDVAKFSSLPFGNAFEFSAEILADTHAYLSLPFARTEEHAENWAGKGKINKNGRNNDHQKAAQPMAGNVSFPQTCRFAYVRRPLQREREGNLLAGERVPR